ncbi:MAG TPA: elongation factor P [Chloroflexota bacterium]
MISTGELRKGVVIEIDGQLCAVLDYQHLKLGRGSAQVRLRLRNVRTNAIFERTVQAGERFNRVRLEQRPVQFLYSEDNAYYFMDQETFDQFALTREQLGDAVSYLKEGTSLEISLHEGEPVGVELPVTVDLTVTRTEPGVRGDTATGGTKPAVLETGLTIQVPLFVEEGDVVRVDTRTGEYVTRVSGS